MTVYILSVGAIVKPIKVISDGLISTILLKFVSGLCSESSTCLSLRGATKWPCA